MRLILIGALALLVGCASAEYTEQEMALIQAQIEQQTLQIKCPQGCEVAYRDPRQQIVLPPQETNGWDALIAVGQSVERVATTAVVPAAMGYVAAEGFKALQGSGAVTTVTTNTTTRNTTTNTEIGDYSGAYSGSTGDYSGRQSGNSGELISDNSGSVRSPVDSTHPPRVVTQPEPVIVPPAEPVIVPPADPIVVPSP